MLYASTQHSRWSSEVPEFLIAQYLPKERLSSEHFDANQGDIVRGEIGDVELSPAAGKILSASLGLDVRIALSGLPGVNTGHLGEPPKIPIRGLLHFDLQQIRKRVPVLLDGRSNAAQFTNVDIEMRGQVFAFFPARIPLVGFVGAPPRAD